MCLFRIKHATRRRSGITIVVVIVFYAIATTFFGNWLRTSLHQHKQARLVHEKRQTVWLADSGIRRAVAMITQQDDYSGEIWLVDATDLGGNYSATVEIRVARSDKDAKPDDNDVAKQYQITAIAELPAGSQRHARFTKSTNINISNFN